MHAHGARNDGPSELPARLRILVADDNRDAADSMATLCHIWGHEARVAYDGPSALKLLAAEPPDVVLADLAMPGFAGDRLARELRAVPGGHYFTLVAVTGYAETEYRDLAVAAGFDHYLVKPVEPSALAGLLADIHRKAHETIDQARALVGRAGELTRETQGLVAEARQLRGAAN
jgi:two-component system CheB/CheR fusion protein